MAFAIPLTFSFRYYDEKNDFDLEVTATGLYIPEERAVAALSASKKSRTIRPASKISNSSQQKYSQRGMIIRTPLLR